MKTAFTAKYLQHLSSKKKNNEGFTLIELLVVIIIVGVLAAIALPSFLNQIGKARGSEGKAVLGTLNRAQQAYRLEEGSFSSDISRLDAQVTNNFFTFAGVTGTAANAQMRANPATDDVKGYSSMVGQTATAFQSIICESDAIVASGGTATVPTSVTACATGYSQVD